MKLYIMPFGKPAWEMRKALLKEIAGRPAPPRPAPRYDYRDVLYLVPNERKVKALKALFLDLLAGTAGVRACIPPRFDALNQFLNNRLGSSSKRPLIDKMTKGLVLEEISRRVSPDAPGPSIASVVAAPLDRLYAYGVEDRAVEGLADNRMPLELLLAVKRGYEAWLDKNGLADPAALKAGYSPSTGEFAAYRTVILDGFYDADPAETRLFKALAGLPECSFILEAPGLERAEARREGMPYFGADRLLEALGADISGMSAGDGAAGLEAGVFSGALFEGRPLRESLSAVEGVMPLPRDIAVVGALNPAEEVYFIARSIKEGFLKGEIESLGRVLVYFPEPDPYMPLIEEAFTEKGGLGIPYHLSQGYPLLQSPAVAALINLMNVPLEGYSFQSIRRVLSSPLVMLEPSGNQTGAFDRFARLEGITGGRARWAGRLARPGEAFDEAAIIKRPLERLMSLLDAVDMKPSPLPAWAKATLGLLDASGIAASVKAREDSHPELASALDALNKAVEELRDISPGLMQGIGLREYVQLLRGSLAGRRHRPGPDKTAGVRVLGSLETLSEPFDVVYAGGLLENEMPSARRPDVFLPDEVSRRLGLPVSADLRARDARLFLGICLGARKVCLCHPESAGGSPSPPSPYLRALEPFYRAGAIKRETRVCRGLAPGDALSPGELLRAAALGVPAYGDVVARDLNGLLRSLPQDTPGVGRAVEALSPARPPRPPAAPTEREFTVTELEEYILCHYRYYHAHVAKSAPEDEPEDDIAPHRAGSVVHEILREFYDRTGAVTEKNREKALTLLMGLAKKRFGALPDTVRNRELLRRFVQFLAPRFIEAEASMAGTGFSVCGTEMRVTVELEDDAGGHIVVTGKIDRLEMDKDGDFIVADYKTGIYPGSGKPIKDMFQLPLYAHAVRNKGGPVEGRTPARPAGFVYYDLREGGMRDVAAFDEDVPGVSLKATPPQRGKTGEEMDALIKGSVEAALRAAKGILSGDFRPTCEYPYICERCIYARVCVKGKALDEAEGEGPGEGVDGRDDGEG